MEDVDVDLVVLALAVVGGGGGGAAISATGRTERRQDCSESQQTGVDSDLLLEESLVTSDISLEQPEACFIPAPQGCRPCNLRTPASWGVVFAGTQPNVNLGGTCV